MAQPPKIYVVKLNCGCTGCQTKVKGVFQELHGVNLMNIDGEKRKVTFTASMELNFIVEKLIKKLAKKGVHGKIMDEPPPPAPPPAPAPPPSRPLNIHVTHFVGPRPASASAPTNHCHSVSYEMGPANNRYPCGWQMEQVRQLAQSQPIKSVIINFGEPAQVQPDGRDGPSECSKGAPPPQMPIYNYFSDENANSCRIM